MKSDPTLLAEIRQYGAFDTSACYQCGSCTITCNFADESASFPRMPIRYALLGLREPVLASLDPWLCYYCGDCSTTCPREAEPAEAMMTLRRYLATQYDWTGLASAIFRSRVWGIGAHVAVGALVLLLALLYHLYVVRLTVSELVSLPLGMGHMFDTITIFTRSVFVVALLLLLSNAGRMYWLTMHRTPAVRVPLSLYLVELKTFVVHALTQRRFRECLDRGRWIKHMALAAGCIVMFVLVVFFLKWFQTDNLYPIYHPQRWIGYLAAGALIYVSGDMLLGRARKRDEAQRFSAHTDWILPILLLLTAVTGVAVHAFRYLEFSLVAHFTYAVHLAVVVPLLVVEMPFGKWSHVIYRPFAVYLHAVKQKALERRPAEAPVAASVG